MTYPVWEGENEKGEIGVGRPIFSEMTTVEVAGDLPTPVVKHTGWRHAFHHVKYGLGVVAVNMGLFPVEHWAWENLPLLRSITEALGL